MRLLFACAVSLLATACFKSPTPECAFACDPGAAAPCPDGYTCRTDGLCRRADIADSFACPDVAASGVDAQVDGAELDASQPDAPPDAPAIDATALDASDAPPDAANALLTITTADPVDFGMVAITTTVTRMITVRNGGTTRTSPISVNLVSVPPSGFAIVPGATQLCRDVELAAGTECTFEVGFTPTVVQSYSATVTVSAVIGGADTVQATGAGM